MASCLRFGILALGLVTAASPAAVAGYTPIVPIGHGNGSERCTSGVQGATAPGDCPAGGAYGGLWSIVKAIANDDGGATATRIPDTGAGNAQVWVALAGNSLFQRARYAMDNSTVGFFAGASGGDPGGYAQVAGVIGPNNTLRLSTLPAGQDINGEIAVAPVTFTPMNIPVGTTFRLGLDDLSSGSFWSSLAADDPDGIDHMAAWRLTGGSILGGIADFVIAIEDVTNNRSDHDFNDYVFEFREARPIPEPASPALLGMALTGLWAVRRRKAA